MADMFSSAVVQETVSQILSDLVQNYEEKGESNTNRNLERLEMAHIRLEAALETSCKWQISDASLLRWRKKLKRAAQECDDVLHRCKQRIIEEEQNELEVRNSPLPNRIAHATKTLFISVFSGNKNELNSSTVRRFEWFAAGASEFLRFVELGGTPRRHIPFQSLVNNLFADKEIYHTNLRGNEYPFFRLWLVPKRSSEYGREAGLIFVQEGGNGPEVNIYFSIILQLSESTDIVGITIKCLYLLAPHLKYAVENIRKELTQLYTQNFSWVPSVYSHQTEHWDNLHTLASQWYRPNPLCCKQRDRHEHQLIDNSDLESVNEVCFYIFLQKDMISLQDTPCMKVGMSFAPHGSLHTILPENKSSAVVTVVGKEQYGTDITFEHLKEVMVPKAIDYFCQNADAAIYQMIWKSEHGYALIHFENASKNIRRSSVGARKRKLMQEQSQGLKSWIRVISFFLQLWGAHMPIRLQRFMLDWLQKMKEDQFAEQYGQPYHIITCMVRETKKE